MAVSGGASLCCYAAQSCKFDTKKSSSVAKWLTKCQSNTRQMRAGGGQGTKCAPNVHQTCTERRPGGGAHALGYQIGFKWLSNAHQM